MPDSFFEAQRITSDNYTGTVHRQNLRFTLGSGDERQQSYSLETPNQLLFDPSEHDVHSLEAPSSFHLCQAIDMPIGTEECRIPPGEQIFDNIFSSPYPDGSTLNFGLICPSFFRRDLPSSTSHGFPMAFGSNFAPLDSYGGTLHSMADISAITAHTQYDIPNFGVFSPYYNVVAQGFPLLLPSSSIGGDNCGEVKSSDGLDKPGNGLDEVERYIDYDGRSEHLTQRPDDSQQGNDSLLQSPCSPTCSMNDLTNTKTVQESFDSMSDNGASCIPTNASSPSSRLTPLEDDSTVCGSLSPCSNTATLCDQQSPEPLPKFLPKHLKQPSKPRPVYSARHSQTSGKKCPECGRVFAKAHQLNKHNLTHTRPFHCRECTFRGSVKRDLTRHVNSVHRPDVASIYYCPFMDCDRSKNAEVLKPFSRHDNLVRHVRKIHGEEIGTKQARSSRR